MRASHATPVSLCACVCLCVSVCMCVCIHSYDRAPQSPCTRVHRVFTVSWLAPRECAEQRATTTTTKPSRILHPSSVRSGAAYGGSGRSVFACVRASVRACPHTHRHTPCATTSCCCCCCRHTRRAQCHQTARTPLHSRCAAVNRS